MTQNRELGVMLGTGQDQRDGRPHADRHRRAAVGPHLRLPAGRQGQLRGRPGGRRAAGGPAPTLRHGAGTARFLVRAVDYLAARRASASSSTSAPASRRADNVHEVAQRIAPEARILYVDNDPIVLAHARALMTSTPEGRTAFIHADLRQPETILDDPALRDVLDLGRPVALFLVGVLHHLHDDDPRGIVRPCSRAAVAAATSRLTPSADFDPAAMAGWPRPRSGPDPLRAAQPAERRGSSTGWRWSSRAGADPRVAARGACGGRNAVHGWAALARKP